MHALIYGVWITQAGGKLLPGITPDIPSLVSDVKACGLSIVLWTNIDEMVTEEIETIKSLGIVLKDCSSLNFSDYYDVFLSSLTKGKAGDKAAFLEAFFVLGGMVLSHITKGDEYKSYISLNPNKVIDSKNSFGRISEYFNHDEIDWNFCLVIGDWGFKNIYGETSNIAEVVVNTHHVCNTELIQASTDEILLQNLTATIKITGTFNDCHLVNICPEKILYLSKKPSKTILVPFGEIHKNLMSSWLNRKEALCPNTHKGYTAIVADVGFIVSINKGKRFIVNLPIAGAHQQISMSKFANNTEKSPGRPRHKYHAEHAFKYFLETNESVQTLVKELLIKLTDFEPGFIKVYAVLLFLHANNSPCNESDCEDLTWNIQYHKNCEQILSNLQSTQEPKSFISLLKDELLKKNIHTPKNNDLFPRMFVHFAYQTAYCLETANKSKSATKELIDMKKLSGKTLIFSSRIDAVLDKRPQASKEHNKHNFFVSI